MALGIRIPKPKSKVRGMSLMPRITPPRISSKNSIYKKSALFDDPTKFGNFGYDINQLTPLFTGKK